MLGVGLVVYLLSAVAICQPELAYYKAQVPVKSQAAKERKRAAQEGLKEVVLRLSGVQQAQAQQILVQRSGGQVPSSVIDNAVIQQRLKRAISYVEQFQYKVLDDEALKQQGYSEWISLRFSPSVIEGLLVEAGLSLWPINRPTNITLA